MAVPYITGFIQGLIASNLDLMAVLIVADPELVEGFFFCRGVGEGNKVGVGEIRDQIGVG